MLVRRLIVVVSAMLMALPVFAQTSLTQRGIYTEALNELSSSSIRHKDELTKRINVLLDTTAQNQLDEGILLSDRSLKVEALVFLFAGVIKAAASEKADNLESQTYDLNLEINQLAKDVLLSWGPEYAAEVETLKKSLQAESVAKNQRIGEFTPDLPTYSHRLDAGLGGHPTQLDKDLVMTRLLAIAGVELIADGGSDIKGRTIQLLHRLHCAVEN